MCKIKKPIKVLCSKLRSQVKFYAQNYEANWSLMLKIKKPIEVLCSKLGNQLKIYAQN